MRFKYILKNLYLTYLNNRCKIRKKGLIRFKQKSSRQEVIRVETSVGEQGRGKGKYPRTKNVREKNSTAMKSFWRRAKEALERIENGSQEEDEGS